MPGTGGSGAVTRNTLRQQIADALRDELLAGRLPAGQQFTVKEIADQYEVSATPVREALVDLSAQGLLDVEQHRGFRVHQFTAEDYRSMIEARVLIIEGIFRLAAQKRPLSLRPEVIASVRRRAEEAERAARCGDLDILIGYDLRYWRELGGLVGNRYISEFLDRVRIQSWVFAVPYLRAVPELRNNLWSGHSELVDAVAAHDAAAAEALVADYTAQSMALIERLSR